MAKKHQELVKRFLPTAFLTSGLCFAEATFDNSLGQRVMANTLSGAMTIPEARGDIRGTNLFHSFDRFNIKIGESATFTGDSAIENILSRVTGGNLSTIDGVLATDFSNTNPNFFLINPAGAMFGPNASLDVQGSFHVSTADFIRMADGVRFNASPSAEDAVLSTAPPEAFGFLGENPGSITFEGSGSSFAEINLGLEGISVPEGKTLSVIGGDIAIKSGELLGVPVETRIRAPSGRINIASADVKSEVILESGDLRIKPMVQTHLERLGNIEVAQGSVIDATGGGGKGLFIRAGMFTLTDRSTLDTSSIFGGDSGNISIHAKDSIHINQSSVTTSIISIFGAMAGDMSLVAPVIEMTGVANSPSRIDSTVNGGTDDVVGNIEIQANILRMLGYSIIESTTAVSSADGGNISVQAEDSIEILGPGNFISSSALGGTGNAGNIRLSTDILKIINDNKPVSFLGAFTVGGDGKGGSIDIQVDEQMIISGNSSISTDTDLSSAAAGDTSIRTRSLEIIDGAKIAASSGKNVIKGIPNPSTGPSGNISITATDSLLIQNGGAVTVETAAANAGNIDLKVGMLLLLRDKGAITTSAAGGLGSGGDIIIGPDFVVLDNGSTIQANALAGMAGAVDITADFFFQSPDSLVEASAGPAGIDGTVNINSPVVNIAESVAVLPESFFDASQQLSERCSARLGGSLSSFIAVGRGGLPIAPEDLAPAMAFPSENNGQTSKFR